MISKTSDGGRVVRLGAGAGFARDRIEPSIDLAKYGELDYLIFECLAERTLALAQQQKEKFPDLGYDPMFELRMHAVLPVQRDKGFRIVTNMGAVNPAAAGRLALKIAAELGIAGLKVAIVEGDDVLREIRASNFTFLESGEPVGESRGLVSANAYLGASAICEALASHADLIICGRVADPALFLGPLVHEFGWSMTDWDKMGVGTLVGHMLECAGQVSGGYFADPGYKDVQDLHNLGFPIGEVSERGDLVISKLPATGGCITAATCKEQLIYEIHDPREYFQPDVVADFSEVRVEEIGPDRVRLSGAKGATRPATLKVSVAYRDGYVGEGQISYGGSGAVARARLAGDIVRDRLKLARIAIDELKVDFIGIDALHGRGLSSIGAEPYEVRLRVAARVATQAQAEAVIREVESLYTNGPAGGGGVTQALREVIAVQSVLIPRERVRATITMLEA
jgi:hypothetical protein